MPEPYRPRTRARLADGAVGAMPLKVHWIDAQGDATPPAGLLEAAMGHASATLPSAMAAEGGSEGAAFAVLHRGHAGTWLLLDWWAHGDILCQRLARAEPGTTRFEPMDHLPLTACIWELEVIGEERRAWIEHVLTDRPSLGSWRAA